MVSESADTLYPKGTCAKPLVVLLRETLTPTPTPTRPWPSTCSHALNISRWRLHPPPASGVAMRLISLADMPPRRPKAAKGPPAVVSVPALNTRSKSSKLQPPPEPTPSPSPSPSPSVPHPSLPSASSSENPGPLNHRKRDAGRFDDIDTSPTQRRIDDYFNPRATPTPGPAVLTPPATEHPPSKRPCPRPRATESVPCHAQDEEEDRAPDPWIIGHVQHGATPCLTPHAALQAVKLFLGTPQATAVRHMLPSHPASLTRPESRQGPGSDREPRPTAALGHNLRPEPA